MSKMFEEISTERLQNAKQRMEREYRRVQNHFHKYLGYNDLKARHYQLHIHTLEMQLNAIDKELEVRRNT